MSTAGGHLVDGSILSVMLSGLYFSKALHSQILNRLGV